MLRAIDPRAAENSEGGSYDDDFSLGPPLDTITDQSSGTRPHKVTRVLAEIRSYEGETSDDRHCHARLDSCYV